MCALRNIVAVFVAAFTPMCIYVGAPAEFFVRLVFVHVQMREARVGI